MKNTSTKNLYAFVLGREQKIALKEVESVLRSFCFGRKDPGKNTKDNFSIFSVDNFVAIFNIKDVKPIEVSRLIGQLGGTIKIFRISSPREKNIKGQILSTLIKQNKGKKLKFGISNYSDQKIYKNLGFEIKSGLKKRNISSKFVQEKEGDVLSSAESFNNIIKKKGVEVAVLNDYIAILIASTNPSEWAKRDFGKPKGDKFSGLTPPKLARMMINITANKIKNPLILDPFCGSGNILLEAMTLRHDFLGSDISKKAVSDSIANLIWLANQYKIQIEKIERKIEVTDATVREFPKSENGTIIVTEPYLGKPQKEKMTKAEAIKEIGDIKPIFIGFLKNIYSQKDKMNLQRACVVFPSYDIDNNESISLYEEIVDEIEKIGYTTNCSLRYGRDYQVVKRQIVIFDIK